MSEIHEQQSEFSALTSGTPRWVGLVVAVLAGVSLLALGVSWSAASRARNVEQSSQAALKQSVDQLNQRLARSDEVNQQLQSDVRDVC